MSTSLEHRASAVEQLIRLSAGTAARREAAGARAEHLAAMASPESTVRALRERRLLTLLGPRLAPVFAGREGDFEVTVAEALEAGQRHATMLQMVADRLIGALTESGIRCAQLKGAPLSMALYGDLARRPSSDIDLLVEPESLPGAVEVVRGLGYMTPADPTDRHGLPRLHFALDHASNSLPPVELHWRVHWYECQFAIERLLAPLGQAGHWRPAPADELAALLLFYARDGFMNLRHAVDLGAWWDTASSKLEPGALDEVLERHAALQPVLLTAGRVAERAVGLPFSKLTGRAEAGRRARIAERLARCRPASSEPQVHAEMGLIDGLLAPAGGYGEFLRRQIIPPRAVLREQAERTGRNRAHTPLGHGMRTLGRFGLTIPRLAQAPHEDRAGPRTLSAR
jgi:Uncharacterised nucleotidyltransferase